MVDNTKKYNTEEAIGVAPSSNPREAEANAMIEEETKEYILNAMNLLHSEKTRDNIFDMILSKPDPVESMSDVIVLILNRIDASIKNAGKKVSDAARLASTFEITTQVIEIAVASGELEEPTEEESTLVLAVAVEKYIKKEIKEGRMDPQKLAAEVDEMMKRMDPEEKEAMLHSMDSINNTVKERAGKSPAYSPHMATRSEERKKREGGQQQGQQQGQGAQQGQQQGQQQQSALGGA